MTNRPLRLAVLISGGGRTMANLQQQISDGNLPAEIEVVICSRDDVAGLDRAKALGLRTLIADRRRLNDEAFQGAITDAVAGVDLVCMAGFLSLWRIPDEKSGLVINIHPALLPEFGGKGMYGMRVHRAVLAAGKAESGCTVHFCDNEYDHGPIILQRRVAVRADDQPEDLSRRVFEQECIAYPEAIRLFCENRIRLAADSAVIFS